MANTKSSPYVVARNNHVEFRRTNFSGPIQIFAHGAVSAVMNGDTIVVTFKTGRVALYKLSKSGNSVIEEGNI
jgi:hypothetical protein